MCLKASLEKKVSLVALGVAESDAASFSVEPPVSLKATLDSKMVKALDACWALLVEFGPSCPRFAKLSSDGAIMPAMKAVQLDVFRSRFTTSDGVMGMVRGTRTILKFHSAAQASV